MADIKISLALYHPQIPQNTGTLLRTASCLGVHVDLIRPLGFILSDKKLKRAGMDYLSTASYEIHDSFENFLEKYKDQRLIALNINNSSIAHHDFRYKPNDVLVVGSEHYGFLENDIARIPNHIKIPMLPNKRSINMAIASAIVLSEVISQLKLYRTIKN
jgi:tRNA (cytidine/uridine-2'-O-)-methyltransferase